MAELSAGLCVLGWVGRALWSLKKKIKCPSLYCIVIPSRSGKSQFISGVESDQWYLMDVEQKIKAISDETDLAKLEKMKSSLSEREYAEYFNDRIKEHLKEYRKAHPHAKILLFTSDPRLPKHLGVRDVLYLAPANKLYSFIVNQSTSDDIKKAVTNTRDLILKFAGKKLEIYNSFEQLSTILCAKFGLKPRL